jgi:Ca2+-transporting ATPase
MTPPIGLWRRLITQFRSPLIYILIFALAVDLTIWLMSGHSGWPVESFAIALILLLNAGLGVFQESKAETALARLKAMSEALVWVMRDGQMVHLPSTQLVPGDAVRIEAGDRVPADGTLTQGHGVMVDESVLTGESLAVEKAVNDEVFSGTLMTRGKGFVKVTRTGAASAAGNLAVMIGAIEADQTPLERRLAKFGARIAWWILLLAAVIVLAGVFIEGLSRFDHVLLFAVALAVAAIR